MLNKIALALGLFLAGTLVFGQQYSPVPVNLGPTMQVFVTGTDATYTPPAGVRTIEVTVVGGGGGSGGASGVAAQFAAGGGGGGGGTCIAFIASPTPTALYSVGLGGIAGAAAGGAGGVGGTSCFGGTAGCAASPCSATGGAAGGGMVSGTTSLASAGGIGGIGSSTLNAVNRATFFGGPGGIGVRTTTLSAIPGIGGSSYLGAGREQTVGQSADGVTGLQHGGGASGAISNSATSRPGAPGAIGVVIVREFY